MFRMQGDRATRTTISTTAEPLPLLFALGANVGRPVESLRWALVGLEGLFGPLRVAPLYRSAPVSPVAQPDFLNTVALADGPGSWTPLAILAKAQELEARAGRRAGIRFGPRPLDIDLLLCGEHQCEEPELTLPHPRLRERRFVLQPLADLVPDLALPPDGAKVSDLLERLGTEQRIELVAAGDWASRESDRGRRP